ncbi:hypothetical protein SVAN01_06432 [Stagonosporopsis vannaccii]|nr:hypothetical protein SVAN01_06432 [Stagonosporopsis vannaccii]
MRLLTISENDELSLVERVGSEIEPYAILSHTWGADSDEISYKDFTDGHYRSKRGFVKLAFCQNRTKVDNLNFFWVDTCCIDKSSSAELTEAINSMYRWYQGAARCYVFLSDVTVTTNLPCEAAGGSDEDGRCKSSSHRGSWTSSTPTVYISETNTASSRTYTRSRSSLSMRSVGDFWTISALMCGYLGLRDARRSVKKTPRILYSVSLISTCRSSTARADNALSGAF